MSLIYKSLQRLEQDGSPPSAGSGRPQEAGGERSDGLLKRLLLAGALLTVLLFLTASAWYIGSGVSDQHRTAEADTSGFKEKASQDGAGPVSDPTPEQGRAADRKTALLEAQGGARPQASAESQSELVRNGGENLGRKGSHQPGAAFQPAPASGTGKNSSIPELTRAGFQREGRRIRLSLEFTSRPRYILSREKGAEELSLVFERALLRQEALMELFHEQVPGCIDVSIQEQSRQLDIRVAGLESCHDFILQAGLSFGPRLVCDFLLSRSDQAGRSAAKSEAAKPGGPESSDLARKDSENGQGAAERERAGSVSSDGRRTVPCPDGLARDGQKSRTAGAPRASGGDGRPQETAQTGSSDLAKTVRAPKSPQELAEEEFKAGRRALSRGNWLQAEKNFHRALQKAASHGPSRESLASIYIRTGREKRAERLLRQGLSQDPDSFGLRSLLAGIFLRQESWDEVLEVLGRGEQPSINERPEHFAMMAYAFRKKEAYAQSAEIYSGLSRVQPGRGKWWLGLGLSREGQNRMAAAAKAYGAALECSDLTPQLRSFLEGRRRSLLSKR